MDAWQTRTIPGEHRRKRTHMTIAHAYGAQSPTEPLIEAAVA